MNPFQIDIPTKVLFGAGQLGQLHAQALPGKRALIVISSGKSTRANGYLERTEKELAAAGIATAVFDQIQANPTLASVEAGTQAAREMEAEMVVALGGGSVMDAAKAIALMAVNEGSLWDYVNAGTGKGAQHAHRALPVIAITTTAGTGSEVDACSVITNQGTHEKIGLKLPDLFPWLAVVDPELMLTVPARLTAYQGFDALFHSLETYVSRKANLLSDMLASTAIRAVRRYLPRAVADGGDMEARTQLAFANTLSGYAMVTGGCTSQHSLEHAMSAYHETLPHGAGLLMITLSYFGWMLDQHICDDRFVDMAHFLGKENAEKPTEFLEVLERLQEACGVAGLKMSDYGILPEEFPKMAENATTAMKGLFLNDRRSPSREECVAIYQKAYR